LYPNATFAKFPSITALLINCEYLIFIKKKRKKKEKWVYEGKSERINTGHRKKTAQGNPV